jgi:lipoprotein NlpD
MTMLQICREKFKQAPYPCLRVRTKSRRLMMLALSSLLPLTILSACSSRLDNAPVLERSASSGGLLGVPPGYYRVKTGDTLYRIAVENQQSYQAIAAWNNLQDPKQIEVGQLLRIAPMGQGGVPSPGQNGNASTQAQVLAAPIPFASVTPISGTTTGTADTGTSTPSAKNMPAPSGGAISGSSGSAALANIHFTWPVNGPILSTFNESQNKGIDIGGTLGTAVKAASGGRVVYAGNGLRGYGNLIIIKHDNLFLSAYAHNHKLHVKEGDIIKKGDKIAEMGNSDAARVMLHFEIRKQGKPVDPLKYLPDPSTSNASASSSSQAP